MRQRAVVRRATVATRSCGPGSSSRTGSSPSPASRCAPPGSDRGDEVRERVRDHQTQQGGQHRETVRERDEDISHDAARAAPPTAVGSCRDSSRRARRCTGARSVSRTSRRRRSRTGSTKNNDQVEVRREGRSNTPRRRCLASSKRLELRRRYRSRRSDVRRPTVISRPPPTRPPGPRRPSPRCRAAWSSAPGRFSSRTSTSIQSRRTVVDASVAEIGHVVDDAVDLRAVAERSSAPRPAMLSSLRTHRLTATAWCRPA